MIKLENAVARSASLGYRLSCDCWQDGHYTFYRNAVPFSFYTGHVYADQLAQFFVAYAEQYPKDAYFVYELGAGTGMLSKHFLDRLRVRSADLYGKTTVFISDSSGDLIRDLEASQFFKGHEGRYQIAVMDALAPQFSEPADVTFFSNLIDSTPAHHFEVVGDDIFELFVETHIEDDAVIMDGAVYPPVSYVGEEILPLLATEDTGQQFAVRTQLGSLIREDYSRIGLTASGLSEARIQRVREIVKANNLGDGAFFNVHFEAMEALQSILDQSTDSAAVVMSDFGFFTKNVGDSASDLTKRYTNHLFTSVYFDLFRLSELSFSTRGLEKQSETLILFKGDDAKPIQACCDGIFESPQQTIQMIDSIAELNGTEDLQAFQDILKQLPKLCQLNISFMAHCLSYHLSSGHVDLVRLLSKHFIELYQDLSLMGYYFQGVCALMTQDNELARDSFLKTLAISDGQFHHSYIHLAQLAEATGQTEDVVYYYKQLLKFGGVNDKKMALEQLRTRISV